MLFDHFLDKIRNLGEVQGLFQAFCLPRGSKSSSEVEFLDGLGDDRVGSFQQGVLVCYFVRQVSQMRLDGFDWRGICSSEWFLLLILHYCKLHTAGKILKMSKQQSATKLVKKDSSKRSAAPQLGDSQEGTEEHVDDSKSAANSRSGLVDMSKGKPPKPNSSQKKGKITVELKHSGDFKTFDSVLKDLTAKMEVFKSSITTDPVSVISQQVTDSLMMSMLDAAMHREQPALRTVAKNMEDYSTKGFQTNPKVGSDPDPKTLARGQSGVGNTKKDPPAETNTRDPKKKDSVVSGASKRSKSPDNESKKSEVDKKGEEDEDEERELNGENEQAEEEAEAEQEAEEEGGRDGEEEDGESKQQGQEEQDNY